MPPSTPKTDWRAWLRRWDRQQSGHVFDREERYTAMLDTLEALLPARFTVADLGCGPGSMTQRLAKRFPKAHIIAIDFDPLLQRIGREAIGTQGGRIEWIEADFRRPDWKRALPVPRIDAAVSTTALHWLRRAPLRRLYRDLHGLLRSRGVFLNGDTFPEPASHPLFRKVAERVGHARARAGRTPGWEAWSEWWSAIEKDPTLSDLVQERRSRFPSHHPREENLDIEEHRSALVRAGFREVGVLWQEFDNRVLFAAR
ncbi:MAG: class I SAM-dependent methyltransferase [Thermoplasmata archaeon]